MPYIITTRKAGAGYAPGGANTGFHPFPSRRAVATLEEAREAVRQGANSYTAPGMREFAGGLIIESGGTIGPLPDGCVIEVERVTWELLAVGAQTAHQRHDRIIDAYNAREKVS